MKESGKNATADAAALMKPFGMDFDLVWGIMKDPDNHIIRLASSMKGHYKDAAALEDLVRHGDPVHYEVFEKKIPEQARTASVLHQQDEPGDRGGRVLHDQGALPCRCPAGTAEVYLCLRGEGYMLMSCQAERAPCERFLPGRMVYVPPFWGHRTVNTGEGPLISFCVYPGEAGHNYGDIEKEGFPVRVFKRAGKVDIVSTKG